MFSVNIARGVRHCAVSQWASKIQVISVRGGKSFNAFNGVLNQRGHGGETRSFLNTVQKSWSSRPASCCLSTVSPSEDGSLIYAGNLGNAVRGVKMFSYATSMTSLCMMPHILINTGLGAQSLLMQAAVCGVIGFFTFLTPVLLHLITKGYVVRLYHDADRDTYTAVTYSVVLIEKKTVFHQRQVRIPAISKMFTTFYASETGLLVAPDLFPIPHDYNHLMGYDKPFDFHTEDMQRPGEN
ncbi:transmembrane protein 70, mitochondrial [Genypterus blacodes]|uniref:transmembrane protein 70, mitochondrial n=1 Tax=Genypterus blacodes TaxID=154954 RepID=UPI003F77736D